MKAVFCPKNVRWHNASEYWISRANGDVSATKYEVQIFILPLVVRQSAFLLLQARFQSFNFVKWKLGQKWKEVCPNFYTDNFFVDFWPNVPF